MGKEIVFSSRKSLTSTKVIQQNICPSKKPIRQWFTESIMGSVDVLHTPMNQLHHPRMF